MIKTLTLSLCSALLTAIPSVAAERISLTFGPWQGSIRISSLETFAKDGTINQNLGFFLGRFSREQQDEFREVLLKRVDLSPVILSRFFNSAIGEDILDRVGRGITIQGGRNGKYALRSAIIKAAFEPEGLTLLNVLRNLPTNMQLQGEHLLALSMTIDRIFQATNFFVEKIENLSTEAAQSNPVNFSQLPDLRQPGKFKFRQETFTLNDASRKRSFYVILYVPETWRTGKTPVVIISHGLGSRPEDFKNIAEQLASYGYVVAMPQHPGSDSQQKQALLNGLSREVFQVSEFIDRPKDASFVVDELERRNQTEFAGRLDLENVGIAGHSFGAYTALAVAGAEVNLDSLRVDCDRSFSRLNVSLLLQCRALSLTGPTYQFKDDRFKAVLVKNPVNSAIFGQKGLEKIQLPLMITGGNYDPATPFVLEQVRAFTWLTTPNKYLGLAEGQAHVDISQLDAGITQLLDAFPDLALAEAEVLDNYGRAMVVAFFEVHIANNAQFSPYLTSAYGEYLSQNQPSKFFLLDTSAQPALQKAVEDFQAGRR